LCERGPACCWSKQVERQETQATWAQTLKGAMA